MEKFDTASHPEMKTKISGLPTMALFTQRDI